MCPAINFVCLFEIRCPFPPSPSLLPLGGGQESLLCHHRFVSGAGKVGGRARRERRRSSFVGSGWVYLNLAGVRRILPPLEGRSGQRRGRVCLPKPWETRSLSLALPLNSLAGHGQVPLPPAPSGTRGSDTPFCLSHLHQGQVLLCCSGTSCGEVGLVWERACSVLP